MAPYWPNRTWFPELMLLATAPPWPIPLRKDPLSQRRGTLWGQRRLSPSTLKVYVAAISTHHDSIEEKSVGKHNLVFRFLSFSLPSCDLALVLRAPLTAPFEPLQSVELRFLSMKTLILTALASIKRVGDLQAFSVDDSCLEFGDG